MPFRAERARGMPARALTLRDDEWQHSRVVSAHLSLLASPRLDATGPAPNGVRDACHLFQQEYFCRTLGKAMQRTAPILWIRDSHQSISEWRGQLAENEQADQVFVQFAQRYHFGVLSDH